MNGAVHGLATTTASTPVKKSPGRAGLRGAATALAAPAERAPKRHHARHRLGRSRTSPAPARAITPGCCSWKPQPSASPACAQRQRDRAHRREADQHAGRVPERAGARVRGSPLCASDSALSDSTGSTQGIRLRIRPPQQGQQQGQQAGRGSLGVLVACVGFAALSTDVGGWGWCAGLRALCAPPSVGRRHGCAGQCRDSAVVGASAMSAAGVIVPSGNATATARVIGG